MANLLIPDHPHDQHPFFRQTSRYLLRGVLIAFVLSYQQRLKEDPEAPGWTFRDVILAMKSREYMEAVLESTPYTRDLLEYTRNPGTYDNIRASILTDLSDYESIAAAWNHAYQEGRRVSLRGWLAGEFILVLGGYEDNRIALDTVNRVLFKRLTELILAQDAPSTEKPSRTWVFLDEVREAGRLEGLPRLLNQGRTKGACVVLGFQDIEGMREVYGERVANELVGQCGNKAVLRAESPEMAEWASRLAGTREGLQEGSTVYFGPGKIFQGTISQYTERKLLLPSEVMTFPTTNTENGLTGFYILPDLGYPFRYTEPGSRLFEQLLVPPDDDVLPIKALPTRHEYLEPDYSAIQDMGFHPQKAEAAMMPPPPPLNERHLSPVRKEAAQTRPAGDESSGAESD